MSEYGRRLRIFGSEGRILVGPPATSGVPSAEIAVLSAEAMLRNHHRLLTRFDPESELSRLNAADTPTVAASRTVLAFLDAARWAFAHSDGLVDATVIDAVKGNGYAGSLALKAEPGTLASAVAVAPESRPALARASAAWDAVELDFQAGTVTRPPGVGFDSGGITKGHTADLVADTLGGYSSFAVDCGGDMRIGGAAGTPRRIEIVDPFSGDVESVFELTRGAVATSGIGRRLWGAGEGFAHHLIDPGRGIPAWSGLVQATAVAPTALEAEVLAKAALLSGPSGAERWLGRSGGLAVDDVGGCTAFGPLREQLVAVAGLEAA